MVKCYEKNCHFRILQLHFFLKRVFHNGAAKKACQFCIFFSPSSICDFAIIRRRCLLFLCDSISKRTSKSADQASCLEDVPSWVEPRYDYLKEARSPGDQFNAVKQCQHAFDKTFFPYVKSEKPFEVRR